MYDEIRDILRQEGRGQVNSIVTGDININMGEGSTNKVVGPFSLGKGMREGRCLDLAVMA